MKGMVIAVKLLHDHGDHACLPLALTALVPA
jgi:hypothetical protein